MKTSFSKESANIAAFNFPIAFKHRLEMRRTFAAATVLCAIPTLVFSQAEPKPRDAYSKCLESAFTNYDFAECGNAEIVRQEARLSIAWKKAYACFDTTYDQGKAAKQSLLEDQRLWVKWKAVACNLFATGYAGREGAVLAAPMCKAKVISDRSEWLENFSAEDNCH